MKHAIYNAKVYVNRGEFAEAVLVEDDLIKKVGTTDEILALAGDAEKIDAEGRTLLPGFNDSHMHLLQFGETLYQANIEGVTSIEDMVERCKTFIQEHPERCVNGIHAIGWNQDMFVGDQRIPDRHDIDKISTEIPIVLERVCGHILVTNTKCIELMGLTAESPQFPDGEFKIVDGYPNGQFFANACNFAKKTIPDFTMEERKEIIQTAMTYAVEHGLTSMQSNDVGTTIMDIPGAFQMFHEIYDSGMAKLRYRHQVCFNDMKDFQYYLTEGEYVNGSYPEGSWLTLGPLKLFKDGSLGARTAFMRKPYPGTEDNYGLEWIKHEDMLEYCKLAAKYNMQVVTHAIGDGAVEKTMDCYQEAFIDGKNKLRHALVHCQITDEGLQDRIVAQDILVMAQPIFLGYDMKIVDKVCGEELASTSYAFGTLIRKGAHLSYGTDCPVESCNPFWNIYQAVTRKDMDGKPEGGFRPQECVDVETAIDAYTVESAYAEFEEDKKGRIKEGMYADMILLDTDIFTCEPDQIKDILPVMTMVGGKIVYKK